MNNTFKTIIFDFDSTLVSIEGIDELARMNGKLTAVTRLTKQAMGGKLKFEDVFYHRLNLIKPTNQNLQDLALLYRNSLIPDAKTIINSLQNMNKKVIIVTNGYKQAILPTAKHLGISPKNTWAIELAPDTSDFLTQIKPNGILPTNIGKRDLINHLDLDRKTAFVGDGATDLLTKQTVDLFIGFGGVEERAKIKRGSKYYITQNSLLPILDIIKNEEQHTLSS